jgi:hypothetical protein
MTGNPFSLEEMRQRLEARRSELLVRACRVERNLTRQLAALPHATTCAGGAS